MAIAYERNGSILENEQLRKEVNDDDDEWEYRMFRMAIAYEINGNSL